MEKLTCPKCGANYTTKKACSNKGCVLSFYQTNQPIDWSHILYRMTHVDLGDIRSAFYKLKNRLFIRHDLIRTGISKWQCCDKDHLMEKAMHNIVVDYVEKEEGLKYHHLDNGDDEHHGDHFKKINEKVLQVYVDIKVTLPMMERVHDELLTKWCDSSHWRTDVKIVFEEIPEGKRLSFPDPADETEECKANWDTLNTQETQLEEFKTQLLHRIVDIRGTLWT